MCHTKSMMSNGYLCTHFFSKKERQRKTLFCLFSFGDIYYSRIKKGEDQGKYVTFSTMMHKETTESLEMTSHHVPLR